MKRTYMLFQQYIAYVLLISFFLQSCGDLNNSPLPITVKKEANKNIDYQLILDKKFSAEGGHAVTFYEYKNELLASLQSLDDKVYNDVEVYIEKGADVRGLPHLPKSIHQQRIQIHCDKKGKPKGITIHKPWLMGGKYDSEDEEEHKSDDEETKLIPEEYEKGVNDQLNEAQKRKSEGKVPGNEKKARTGNSDNDVVGTQANNILERNEADGNQTTPIQTSTQPSTLNGGQPAPIQTSIQQVSEGVESEKKYKLDEEAIEWYKKAIKDAYHSFNPLELNPLQAFSNGINRIGGIMKLSDLIVMDLDGKKAPTHIEWGGNPSIKGHTWNIFNPLYNPQDYKEYEDGVMFIDPSAEGKDETAYCVAKRYGNYYFIKDFGGMAGGYTEEKTPSRDGGNKKVIKKLVTIARNDKVNTIWVESNGNRAYVNLIKNRIEKDLKKEVKKAVKDELKKEAENKDKEEVKKMFKQQVKRKMEDNRSQFPTANTFHQRFPKEQRILSTLYPLLKNHQLIIDRNTLQNDFKSDTKNDLSYKFFYQLITLRRKEETFTPQTFDTLLKFLTTKKDDVIFNSKSLDELVEIIKANKDKFTCTAILEHDDRVDAVASAIRLLRGKAAISSSGSVTTSSLGSVTTSSLGSDATSSSGSVTTSNLGSNATSNSGSVTTSSSGSVEDLIISEEEMMQFIISEEEMMRFKEEMLLQITEN